MNVNLIQGLINGLLVGGIYMTIAVGINLIYGVMRIVNYAHGEVLMIGMYIAYWLFILAGVNPYLAIPIVTAILFVFGVLLQKSIIEPVLDLPLQRQILIFIGLIHVFQNSAMFLWSPDYRSIGVPIARESITISFIYIPIGKLLALIIALASALTLYYFLKKTKLGKFILATSQDPDAASALGIDIRRIRTLTFALSLALTGIAACTLSPIYFIFPYTGTGFNIFSFIIITLGGLGSYTGAIIGSIVVGMIESFVSLLSDASIATAVAFLVFILILLFRPSGIMGRRE